MEILNLCTGNRILKVAVRKMKRTTKHYCGSIQNREKHKASYRNQNILKLDQRNPLI